MIKYQKKIIQELTPIDNSNTLYIVERRKSKFTYPLHGHACYELNFVQNAKGVKRIVGDNVEVIGDYDLVLITGANLEHGWEQNECKSNDIREITSQFNWNFVSDSFLNSSTFDDERRMIEMAKVGIAFGIDTIKRVLPLLDEIVGAKDRFTETIKFMMLLHELAISNDYRTLATSSFSNVDAKSESRRILKVISYIEDNYRKELRLSTLAEMVSMTTVSFSRFFKLRTGKNVMDYIIDVRLGHASRMLVDSTDTVAEICYSSGFNNLSSFDRIFKNRKGCSPMKFREQYNKKIKMHNN